MELSWYGDVSQIKVIVITLCIILFHLWFLANSWKAWQLMEYFSHGRVFFFFVLSISPQEMIAKGVIAQYDDKKNSQNWH